MPAAFVEAGIKDSPCSPMFCGSQLTKSRSWKLWVDIYYIYIYFKIRIYSMNVFILIILPLKFYCVGNTLFWPSWKERVNGQPREA